MCHDVAGYDDLDLIFCKFQWLISDHKFRLVNESPNLTAEEAHKVIVDKGHRQWKDLSKAFITLDGKRTGRITKRGLRELLMRFILPMSDEEFNKLWKRYTDVTLVCTVTLIFIVIV